jgi:prepilin-type N-terminal cleavage/methylation domain-containing protein
MRTPRSGRKQFVRAFTLIELMVTIVIISILASLSLAGLAVARQRVKADRTELTIRKIHEVLMPHYEKFLSRTVPTVAPGTTYEGVAQKAATLVSKRRALVLEMPDGWADLIDTGTAAPEITLNPRPPYSAIAQRLRAIARPSYRSARFSDAECLWATVIRGGFADPAIVGHFREDEFGDKDQNGAREFIDGWGNPIRFLRWAPAFVSRYQPSATAGVDTRSHDAFDPGGVDSLARTTLFPLVFSCGPDGEPAIVCRDAESDFSYPRVAFDPYFATRRKEAANQHNSKTYHIVLRAPAASTLPGELGPVAMTLGQEQAVSDADAYATPFGTIRPGTAADDVHNHAMSR